MALPSLCSLAIPLQSRREENSPSYATLSGETDSKFAQLKIFHFRVCGGGQRRRGLWEGGSHSQMLWIFICALLGIQEVTGESQLWPHEIHPMVLSVQGYDSPPSFLDHAHSVQVLPQTSVMDTAAALPRFSKLPSSSFLELLLTASTCGLQQLTLGLWNTSVQGKLHGVGADP